MARPRMIQLLLKAMSGKHTNSPYVQMRRNRRIDIRSNAPLPIHIDGEIFAYHEDNVRHITITSLPKMLTVIAPPQPNQPH